MCVCVCLREKDWAGANNLNSCGEKEEEEEEEEKKE